MGLRKVPFLALILVENSALLFSLFWTHLFINLEQSPIASIVKYHKIHSPGILLFEMSSVRIEQAMKLKDSMLTLNP